MKKILLLIVIALTVCTGCKKDSKTRVYITLLSDQATTLKFKVYYTASSELIYDSSTNNNSNSFGQHFDLKPGAMISLSASTTGKNLTSSIQCSGVHLHDFSTSKNQPNDFYKWDVVVPDKN